MGVNIAFWVLAIVSIGAALTVVLQRNVFRAALSLVLCFVGVAGLYITLGADFLAAVQVLVYVGGISILIILAIMLTRDVHHGSPSNGLRVPALLVAVLFLGIVGLTILSTPWQVSAPPLVPTTAALADKLLGRGGFILAVEIAAALLLAAVLGAIVLVREK